MSPILPIEVIYADPPWHFRTWSDKGRGRSPKYPTMKFAEIVGLGNLIEPMLAKNAALFLWVTMPFLEKSFQVIRGWGFEYKTCAFTWVKPNKDGESFFQGTGYYTRANAELCLLAVRGSMPVEPADRPPEVIAEPRREHSRKPDCVYDRISGMYPGTVRLELFASKYSEIPALKHRFRPLGYDIDQQDIREALKTLHD